MSANTQGKSEGQDRCKRGGLHTDSTENIRHSISLKSLADHAFRGKMLPKQSGDSDSSLEVRSAGVCTGDEPGCTVGPRTVKSFAIEFPPRPGTPGTSDKNQTSSRNLTTSSSTFFSRLSFLNFSSLSLQTPAASDTHSTTSANTHANSYELDDYEPLPLTRSKSEVVSTSEQHYNDSRSNPKPANSVFSAHHPNSFCQQDRSRSRSAHPRSHSCGPPFFSSSSGPSSPTSPSVADSTPPTTKNQSAELKSSQYDADPAVNLSVHSGALSGTLESPQTSPRSITSFSSLISSLLPMLSGMDDSSDVASGAQSNRSNKTNTAMPPTPPHPAAHPIATSEFIDCDPQHPSAFGWGFDATEIAQVSSPRSPTLRNDLSLPSWPVSIDELPKPVWVAESHCLLDSEVEQSRLSSSLDGQDTADACASAVCDTPLQAAIAAEICCIDPRNANTCSASVQHEVPEAFLGQLVGVMGCTEALVGLETEACQAAAGPGSLLGHPARTLQGFTHVAQHEDTALGLTYSCDKMPLRKGLFAYRTFSRIANADIEAMKIYMLDEQVVLNSVSGMLAYERLGDPSAVGGAPGCGGELQECGLLYSKLSFPVIGARQYVSARRVWHRIDGDGFYVVSVPCQNKSVVEVASKLPAAGGSKHLSTDFFAGYVVRKFEENSVRGVEVASITFDDFGVPAWFVNQASGAGYWSGARSFAEGFRAFESAMALNSEDGSERVSNEVLAALHSAHAASEQAQAHFKTKRVVFRRVLGCVLFGFVGLLARRRK